VRFCLNYVPIFSAADNTAWWQACEAAGIGRIGLGDSPALARELYVTLAACALSTSRIEFMPCVTNPLSRDVSVAASALLSLDELAPGRLSALGIGSGDSAVWATGGSMAPLSALRDYIRSLKALLRGEAAASGDHGAFRLDWATPRPPLDLPIFVATAGPKTLQMAAREADGVIVAMGYAPENVAHVRSLIASACAEVDRDPSEVEVWWNASVQLAESREAAVDAGVNLASSWLAAAGTDGKQIPNELRPALRELSKDTHDLAFMYKNPNRDRILVDRARSLGVYDWLIERSARLWGTPADVVERLRELEQLGLTNWLLNVRGQSRDRLEVVRQLATEVIAPLSVLQD
jgi:alkanesulfonate monooxygenase SsuD/methylene tetrahydromethanopterin reductase-like flavin-dependent oxidoreductase (luciferase family)